MDKPSSYHEDEELKAEAPVLFGLEKRDLTPPDGYFEQFHSKLQERIQTEEVSFWAKLGAAIRWKVSLPVLAVAGIAAFFMFSNPATDPETDPFQEELLAELNNVELDDQLPDDELLYTIDDDLFEAYLTEENTLFSELNTNDIEISEEDEEVIQFLVDAGIEMDEIIEAF